jgi:hypothetical protein
MGTCRFVGIFFFGILALSADFPPRFTAAGVARGDRAAKMIVPGTILTVFGTNLGPRPGECNAAMRSTPPIEYCGTQVLIGNTKAELLFVSDTQINFRVPADLVERGTVDLRVSYNGQSSLPVPMKAGFEKPTLALASPAYTGMPVWLAIDLPYEFGGVGYPYRLGPAGFGCHRLEVRRNGQALPLLPGSSWNRIGGMNGNIRASRLNSESPFPNRLPLHLLYRLDVPGMYEVRYTLVDLPFRNALTPTEIRTQSEWTPMQVLAGSPAQRSEWLRSVRENPRSDAAEILTDVLPGLPGFSDETSFDLLVDYLYHPAASVRGTRLTACRIGQRSSPHADWKSLSEYEDQMMY